MGKFQEIIRNSKDGVLLDLFVIPNAKKTVFPLTINCWRKRIELKVKSEAKDNKANIEIIKVIADFFDISNTDVFIVAGKKKREKTVLIKNLTQKNIKKFLEEFI